MSPSEHYTYVGRAAKKDLFDCYKAGSKKQNFQKTSASIFRYVKIVHFKSAVIQVKPTFSSSVNSSQNGFLRRKTPLLDYTQPAFVNVLVNPPAFRGLNVLMDEGDQNSDEIARFSLHFEQFSEELLPAEAIFYVQKINATPRLDKVDDLLKSK